MLKNPGTLTIAGSLLLGGRRVMGRGWGGGGPVAVFRSFLTIQVLGPFLKSEPPIGAIGHAARIGAFIARAVLG